MSANLLRVVYGWLNSFLRNFLMTLDTIRVSGEWVHITSASMESNEWIMLDQPDIQRLMIRQFDPLQDSRAVLQKLLHRASAATGMEGEHREYHPLSGRVRQGGKVEEACFVAVCNGRVTGTLTLETADPASVCPHYRRPDVATIHRYGVDPSWQRRGIGKALLSLASRWAASHGYVRLALDLPITERRLLDFYVAQGFSVVDTIHFEGRDYDSAVLGRPASRAKVR
jgi:GNAT superfamily N-acetyltransferase